ncbi:NIL domain-containing protein [Egbenema bharatensis]|uniref:NIL domain-containing protein n=1 Tax=Egbenema bharatensis TaxID=3463334 RepID=UPI003A8B9D89
MITATQTARGVSIAHLRIQILIPESQHYEPIFSRLVANHKLAVNVTRTVLGTDGQPRQLDLELTGTIAQMQSGLAYLESLKLKIRGKPNPAGDSWHY